MDSELGLWTELLNTLNMGAVNTTVGLVSGSRQANQRSILDRLAECGLTMREGKGLLVRLNLGNEALPKRQLRTARASEQAPTPVPSPLGPWHEVSLAMKLGVTAPPTLERLPRWLAVWKREYRRILLDLGPLDQPVCRGLGRYCDANLLLLGPETCASPTWLRKHIDHLTQCDARLAGSIVVSASAA